MSCQSCGNCSCEEKEGAFYTIALAGNPNTGKSTVFNALTGLKQHTGNWPGKTVTSARGYFKHKGQKFLLVDLPGTYSLLANSPDEEVTRDYLCFGQPHATIVVMDATSLERNLNLALQVLEITDKVIVCINLIDEAKRKGIKIDVRALEEELGVPVVATAARNGVGLTDLMDKVLAVAQGKITPKPKPVQYDEEIEEQIRILEPKLKPFLKSQVNHRWAALRILEGDYGFIANANKDFSIRSEE